MHIIYINLGSQRVNMMQLFTGSRVVIKLVEHRIAANLVDIKLGDFVQKPYYLIW